MTSTTQQFKITNWHNGLVDIMTEEELHNRYPSSDYEVCFYPGCGEVTVFHKTEGKVAIGLFVPTNDQIIDKLKKLQSSAYDVYFAFESAGYGQDEINEVLSKICLMLNRFDDEI